MENGPVRHAWPFNTGTSQQQSCSTRTSTSTGYTSTSESESGTCEKSTRSETSSTSIRPYATIKRTRLSRTASRINQDSDSDNDLDHHGTFFHGHRSGPDFTNLGYTNDGKLTAPGLDGAELLLAHVGSRVHEQTATRGRRRSRRARHSQHRSSQPPSKWRRLLRAGGHLLLLLGAPFQSVNGLIPTLDHGPLHQPRTYTRTHDLKNQKVIFNPIGRYATDVTFLHAEIRVPYTHISLHINQTEDFINELHKHVEGSHFQASTRNTLEFMRAPIQYSRIRMEEILQKLPEQDASEALSDARGRYKRFFDPISIAVGVGSSILGWVFDFFKAKEVQNLKKDLNALKDNVYKLQDNQKLLFATTVKHHEILVNHTEYIARSTEAWMDLYNVDQAASFTKIQQMSSLCQDEVRTFSTTVALAQLGKINPDQISQEALENVLEFLDLVTETKGMVTPVKSTADIFTMPMSYVFNKARETFYFIVHIPLTRPEQVMDMFEYVPFPMTMSTSENHVVLPRPGHHDVLAINQKQEYQVLTSSELSQCFKLGRVHYCQGRQILRTNFRKTCLGALYVKDAEAASWYCDFQVQPADERVFRVRNDDYLVYTNKEIVATKKCGPSVSQTVQITEGTAVNIPGGCNLQLEDHKIYGEDSIRTEVSETQIFDWNWDAKRVLRNITTPQFLQAMQELEQTAGVVSFETEDILQQVDLDFERKESRDLFSWAKWVTPLISAVISFVLSIFVLGFVRLFLHAHRNRRPKSEQQEAAKVQVEFTQPQAPAPPVYQQVYAVPPVTYGRHQ